MVDGNDSPAADPERAATAIANTLSGAPTAAAGADPDNEGTAVAAPGERIGHFVVRGVLGRGAMGVVLSARDPELDREVAIKVVSPAAGGDDALRRRLLREARAMARLRHPNVISVYEVGEHRGQVYVAMEKIDGETLRDAVRRLERGRGSHWRSVRQLFAAAGRGLAAAHAAGIVHRDFKPENVLVDRNGRVFVGDFGIAREANAEEATESGGAMGDRLMLTRAGEIVGTPAYMAPEQYRGEADARADQFAFCVALYEALYGERPFAGDTFAEYVAAVSLGEVRPPRSDRGVPAWLRAVVVRGLSVKPAARYKSMDALLSELGVGADAARYPGRRARTFLILVPGAVIVAAASAVLGLNVTFTYPIHYITDTSFLVGVLTVAPWIAQTSFNRKVFWGLLGAAISVLALTGGGQLMGITPDHLAALHLLVAAVVAFCGAAMLDPRLGVVAASYFASFSVASAWESLLIPACLFGHLTMVVGLVVILSAPRRTE